jgi:hypothetical protein
MLPYGLEPGTHLGAQFGNDQPILKVISAGQSGKRDGGAPMAWSRATAWAVSSMGTRRSASLWITYSGKSRRVSSAISPGVPAMGIAATKCGRNVAAKYQVPLPPML